MQWGWMLQSQGTFQPDRRCGVNRIIVLFVVGLLLALTLSPGVATAQGRTTAPEKERVITLAQAKPDMGVLKGRWVRPDGGYIIAITNIDAGGKMEAAYYNPKPINVSKAEATREGEVIKVFIELRGPGYPGSTYTLTYDPKTDVLAGIYYQAAMQQHFEVAFVRVK